MLSASIGYARGSPSASLGTTGDLSDGPCFTSQEDIPVLRAIAIAATGDTAVLVDQNELTNYRSRNMPIAVSKKSAGRCLPSREPGSPLEKLGSFSCFGLA